MDKRITLRQFLEMLNSLPDAVKDKPIWYIDISHTYESELPGMKNNLEKDSDTEISLS